MPTEIENPKVEYRIARPWVRYVVVQVTTFGPRVRPFEHPERSFWRYRSAANYAERRARGELPEWSHYVGADHAD